MLQIRYEIKQVNLSCKEENFSMKKLVSDQLVDYLERRGVDYVFGLCGHTVIAMLDAFSRAKNLRYISVRHEQIAATAATAMPVLPIRPA